MSCLEEFYSEALSGESSLWCV